MSKPQAWLQRGLLNTGLAVLGLIALIFIYALVTRFITPRADPAREANPGSLVGDIIQVEVRNGCGIAGLAGTATQYLRDQGFDVVEVGNHTASNIQKTIIVDRVGDLEAAQKVAASLGLPEDRVRQDIRLDYYLDATVIIGHDYAILHPFQSDE